MSKYVEKSGTYANVNKLGSGTPDNTKYLRGDGTWQVPPGAAGGDSITVNGVAVSDADLDDATPAATGVNVNVLWQKDAGSPANISAQVPVGSIKLDDLGTPDDNTDLDVSTTRHGLCPKLPNNTTTFLRGDGSYAAPAAGAWTMVKKSTTQTKNSNTTLANDTDLQFTPTGGQKYHVRVVVFFDTVAAADFKYALSGPTADLIRVRREHMVPGVAAGTDNTTVTMDTAYTGSSAITGTGTNGGYVKMEIILHVNASGSGVFGFQWAQNSSDAGNTSVLAGSYLEYMQL